MKKSVIIIFDLLTVIAVVLTGTESKAPFVTSDARTRESGREISANGPCCL